MNSANLDAVEAGLAAVGSAGEDAVALHREALAMLMEGWHGESASTATDLMRRQCEHADELLDALRAATAEVRSLRDGLGQTSPLDSEQNPAPAPPAYSAQSQPSSAWTPGLPSLPNLGGTLAGLVAQIADAVSFGASGDVSAPDNPPAPDNPHAPDKAPAFDRAPIESDVNVTGASSRPDTAPPPEVPPVQTDTAAPQTFSVETPLLAAERPPTEAPAPEVAPTPPPDAAPPPVEDDRTPCEIAADELPQVGR